jgi:uncharacterized protein YjiS (DUF1127 family)
MLPAPQTPRELQCNIPILAPRPWPRLGGAVSLLQALQAWRRKRRAAPLQVQGCELSEDMRRDIGLSR